MANSLPKTSTGTLKLLNTVSTCSSLFIKPVIDEDIIREINLLDNSKCDDTYDIPVKILKLSKNVIAPTLCYLIKNCINKGVFPSALKIAKVLPIYKGGDKNIASNYRSISILPHFSKISILPQVALSDSPSGPNPALWRPKWRFGAPVVYCSLTPLVATSSAL